MDWPCAPHAALDAVARFVALCHSGHVILPAVNAMLADESDLGRRAGKAQSRLCVVHWAVAALTSEGVCDGTAVHIDVFRVGTGVSVRVTCCVVCDSAVAAEGRAARDGGIALPDAVPVLGPADAASAAAGPAGASAAAEPVLVPLEPVVDAPADRLPRFAPLAALAGRDAAAGVVLGSEGGPSPAGHAGELLAPLHACVVGSVEEAVAEAVAALHGPDTRAAAKHRVVVSCQLPAQRLLSLAPWHGPWDTRPAASCLHRAVAAACAATGAKFAGDPASTAPAGSARGASTEPASDPTPQLGGRAPHACVWLGAAALSSPREAAERALPSSVVAAAGLADPAGLDGAAQGRRREELAERVRRAEPRRMGQARAAVAAVHRGTGAGNRQDRGGAERPRALPGGDLGRVLGVVCGELG